MQDWAEISAMAAQGKAIKEIVRRTGRSRNTVRAALRSPEQPTYGPRPKRPSKLDPFSGAIRELLEDEPTLSAVRILEEITELGYQGGKTILDERLRDPRPRYLPPPRSFQRSVYRPGELCQFDLTEPRREIPVDAGRRFANHLDFQAQLEQWCERINRRRHRTTGAVVSSASPLPELPDVDRHWVVRVPPQPYLRFDRNDYARSIRVWSGAGSRSASPRRRALRWRSTQESPPSPPPHPSPAALPPPTRPPAGARGAARRSPPARRHARSGSTASRSRRLKAVVRDATCVRAPTLPSPYLSQPGRPPSALAITCGPQ